MVRLVAHPVAESGPDPWDLADVAAQLDKGLALIESLRRAGAPAGQVDQLEDVWRGLLRNYEHASDLERAGVVRFPDRRQAVSVWRCACGKLLGTVTDAGIAIVNGKSEVVVTGGEVIQRCAKCGRVSAAGQGGQGRRPWVRYAFGAECGGRR